MPRTEAIIRKGNGILCQGSRGLSAMGQYWGNRVTWTALCFWVMVQTVVGKILAIHISVYYIIVISMA